MSIEHDIIEILKRHGYHLGSFSCSETAVGEPGCGQGFKLKLKLKAVKYI